MQSGNSWAICLLTPGLRGLCVTRAPQPSGRGHIQQIKRRYGQREDKQNMQQELKTRASCIASTEAPNALPAWHLGTR